ncbi:MAG: hypothetical protein ABFD46_08175 [Armatimonadota bacterium]
MKIKNLLFQPLALHLAGDGEGLHLSARECRQILKDRISNEIRLAARRGLVSLIEKAVAPEDSSTGEKPEAMFEQTEQKRGRTR